MSNPFFASDNTSLGSSVRSLGPRIENGDVSSPTPSSESTTITPTKFPEHNGIVLPSKPLRDVSGRQAYLPDVPEKHAARPDYGGSDPNTPRLPPTMNGDSDLDIVPQEPLDYMQRSSNMSDSLSNSSSKLQSQSLKASTNPSLSTSHNAGSRSLNPLQDSSQFLRSYSNAQDDPGVTPRLDQSQRTMTDPPASHPISIPHTPHTKSQGVPRHTRMSGSWGRESSHASYPDQASDAREENYAENRNRSLSRSSQGRVEKRIEATLADAEPSSHARSRKSSHTLGLFKENNASQGARRGRDRSRTASDNAIDANIIVKKPHNENLPQDGQRGRPVPLRHEQDPSLGNTERPVSVHSELAQRDIKHNDSSLQSSSAVSTERIGGSPPSAPHGDMGTTVDISKGSLADKSEKMGDAAKGEIPQRLLEEIRNYHNLAPPFHDKFRSTQPKVTAPGVDLEEKNPSSRHADALLNKPSNRDILNSSHALEDPENEDEEGEHISSALYYPHEAPSPDALEDVSIDDARKAKESQIDMDTRLPEPAISMSDENEVPSEDVDIALQVHNKNRYLHGDMQRTRQPPELEGKPALESGVSSASESEYESLEEAGRPSMQEDSSLTDDAEATPRASPNSRKSYLLSRTRKARRAQAAPLRAVELKPYDNQVGGHTTVFRFSKRAVCKQLSNRENEFYEVVEREHPDLLKFLPRYEYPASALAASCGSRVSEIFDLNIYALWLVATVDRLDQVYWGLECNVSQNIQRCKTHLGRKSNLDIRCS